MTDRVTATTQEHGEIVAPEPESALESLCRAILDGRVRFAPVGVYMVSDGYDSHPVPAYEIEVL